jgi:hypothetical protein
MDTHQALIEFVRSLPIGPAYAPIYAKGQTFGKHQSVSTGKAPHEDSHHRRFNPEDVALLLEKRPEVFPAVGLFTGIRSDGIVILDVDANLSTLLQKWGDSVSAAPQIRSTKKNAAKFVFRVPADQRSLVRGMTLSQGQCGYEILWGMQGVIAGAYPGSSDGKAKPGAYQLVSGDFNAIPDAPEWLLAEMRARKQAEVPIQQGLVKNRRGLDFSGRTQDEVAEIVHDCLQVLPHLGRGSEDQWWAVGAMVAEALPTELGLALWAAWSEQDPAFQDDWVKGNPCEEKWPRLVERVGKPGNLGLGSLVKLADDYDPERLRFQDSSRRTLEEVEATQAQQYRHVVLDFAEVIRRAKEVLQIDNPAELNYKMHALAVEAGYRDKEALERLLVDQIQYEGQTDTMSIAQLMEQEFERKYVIPDLLPSPSVVLIYGAGGDGKSMSAWTLAKHVAMGLPFVVRGKHVPVQQGPVLLLNGDQPLVQLQEQLQEVEMPSYAPVTIRTDWSLQRYAQFISLVQEIRPSLIVIDSLIGCSGGKAFDENKSDFATPLYWLTRNNGVLFPATTILIIHHANKQGGFRGTSAIRDAVDEVWALKRPSERQQEAVGVNARLIAIEKSRSGRGGTGLLLKLEDDLTFTLSDYVPEVDPAETGPSAITDRVLARLRVVYPEARTRAELNADPIVGGRVTAIRKALQRLEKRGLICVADRSNGETGGKALHHYRAVLSSSRVEVCRESPIAQNPCAGTESAMGQGGVNEGVCPIASEEFSTDKGAVAENVGEVVENVGGAGTTDGTPPENEEGCPIAKPLQRKRSAQNGTSTEAIRARPVELVERTVEELERLRRDAEELWK